MKHSDFTLWAVFAAFVVLAVYIFVVGAILAGQEQPLAAPVTLHEIRATPTNTVTVTSTATPTGTATVTPTVTPTETLLPTWTLFPTWPPTVPPTNTPRDTATLLPPAKPPPK